MTVISETTVADVERPARGKLAKIRDDLEFYPHQIDGIRELARKQSFILADEMGLGKSIQALTVAAIDFERFGGAQKVIIVCPASLKGNWRDEIHEHTHFSCFVLPAYTRARREKLLDKFDADILIVNYEQVKPHLGQLNDMQFDIAIFDEAHYIKSRASQRTKAALKLEVPRNFLLTGSPILNQVSDLWPLLNKVDPDEFPNYWRFVNRHAVFGGYMDKQVVGIKNEAELREKVHPRMLRREKKDVLDLPEKQHIVVHLDMSDHQRKLYDQARDELRVAAPLLETGELNIANAMTKMLRLKQILGTTACIPGQPDDSSKLDRAVEMCEEIIANGEPVVVFTQFREVQARMAERCTRAGLGWHVLHGDIPAEQRPAIVRQWTDEARRGQPSVIICMFQVAGVGLNMTAANKMIFLDKDYAPKINEQAEDRIHRIGANTTRPVQIYHLHMRNSIDSRIEAILKRKSDIFSTVIGTDNSEWRKKLIDAVLDDDFE